MPEFSLGFAIGAFAAASLAILVAGPRMVRVASDLASRTGLGEALLGAVFVGAATSLPDAVATITPAVAGLADLAAANALGGVLAQTAFLAVADVAYRRSSLLRASTSVASIMQASLLVILLALLLALMHGPALAILGVHPGTLVLFAVYAVGVKLVADASDEPMWRAVRVDASRLAAGEEVEEGALEGRSVARLWGAFALLTLTLGIAGYVLIPAAERIVEATGMTRTAVGTFMTGVASSLAELVVSITAVRAGAVTLAVGNVFGGNMFDAILVGAADLAYPEGSIYGALTTEHSLIAAVAILATAVTLLGLLRRERGVGRVGAESIVVLALYAIAVVFLVR